MGNSKVRFRKYFYIAPLFLLATGLPVYLQSIHTPFFYDDVRRILRNLDYMHTLDFSQAFFYPVPSRPLFNLVIYLFSLSGLKSPESFHVFSTSLHILNSWLLFILLNRYRKLIDQKTALYISLVFLLHPLAGESVHYIHSFSVLLSTFFILITIIFFSDYFLCHGSRKNWSLGLSFISAFFSYISKETSIILPLLLFLTLVYLLKIRPTVKHLLLFALYFIESSIIILLLFVKGNAHGSTTGFSVGSPAEFLTTQLHYGPLVASWFVLPINQSIYHDLAFLSGSLSLNIIISIFMLIILAVSVFRNKVGPLVLFSLLWMGISVLPTNTLYPITPIITEYRLYLALIGFSVLTGHIISKWSSSSAAKYILFATVLIYFSAFSFSRAMLWRDTTLLWSAALEKYPASTLIRNNLGTAYMEKGKLEKAKQILKSTIEINPYEHSPYHNLGIIFFSEENYPEAIRHFLTVTRLNPGYPYSYYYLGLCYEKLNDNKKKEEYFQKAKILSDYLLVEPPLFGAR